MSPAPAKDVRIPVGTVLDDRFEVLKFLGAGSFGDVYMAQQRVFGHPFRRVALKLFKTDCIDAESAREILSDAVILVSLLDDNPPQDVARRMVQVLDMGLIREPTPRAYMCMQLVPGGKNLDKIVRNHRCGGMPVELSLYYLERILHPLAWMHENNAVHGDLKPDNVLIGTDNDIVLTDFGLAARVDIGVLGGAIVYQAPEVLRGQGGGQAADVYSLGALWYEMLTGKQPFRNIGLTELADKDQRGFFKAQKAARSWPFRRGELNVPPEDEMRLEPASEINAELGEHPQLEAILERCLAARESNRFANAGMLRTEIKKYQKTGAVSSWVLDGVVDKAENPVLGSARTPAQQVADARARLGKGQYKEARQILGKILDQNGDFVPAILADALCLTHLGCNDEAGQQLKRALNLDRRNPAVFDTMADHYQILGQTSQVATFRQKAEDLRRQK